MRDGGNPTKQSANAADETLIAQCPKCGKRYRVPVSRDGCEGRCRCGHTFRIIGIFDLDEPVESHGDQANPGLGTTRQDADGVEDVDTPQLILKLRRVYRSGILLCLAGLYLPLLSLMILSFAAARQDGAGVGWYVLALIGVLAGLVTSVVGAGLWARGKGHSIYWGWSGLAWVAGLLLIYLLYDKARPLRLAGDDADLLPGQNEVEQAYRELPWFRRHHFQAVALYFGTFGWVLILGFIAPLGAIFDTREALNTDGGVLLPLVGLLLAIALTGITVIFSPLTLLIPIVTLLAGGISLPPRRGDSNLRGWGPWRLITCGLTLFVLGTFVLHDLRRSSSQPEETTSPQSPDAVAHLVAAEMTNRWETIASPDRNPSVRKQIEWVEVEGYDPETHQWVGQIKTAGHAGPTTRDFTARVRDNAINLHLYTHDSPVSELISDGEFIRHYTKVTYKP